MLPHKEDTKIAVSNFFFMVGKNKNIDFTAKLAKLIIFAA